jgi:hypothetical protein
MKQGEKETRYWLLAAWLILATLVMVARRDNMVSRRNSWDSSNEGGEMKFIFWIL